MNTTKKLMTLLLAMLVMTACDSKDEPVPDDKVDGDIYVLVASNDRDYVYNLDGDVIFCSLVGSHIASLQSEGSDWYALVKYNGRPNEVIKNGNTVLSTTQEITEFCVGYGKVFTLQRIKLDDGTYQWSYWMDSELRYQLDGDQDYSYRNLIINVPDGPAPLWLGFLEITGEGSNMLYDSFYYGATHLEKSDLVYGYVMSADFLPGNLLYCFEDWETSKYMYSWRYENYELGFIPTQVRVFDHQPYVLGSKATKQTGSGTTREPVVVIDGEETILRTDFLPRDLVDGVKMLQHGDDIYILATGRGCSCIFKNLEPIEVKAGIPNPGYLTDMISLAHCVYKDFVVVDRPLEN